MITNKIELKDDWYEVEKLYKKLTEIIKAEERYEDSVSFDVEFEKVMEKETVNAYGDISKQDFAKAFNLILEDYISKK